MNKKLRTKLIAAATGGHVGYADGATWWNIHEVPWFTGEHYYEIWNDKGMEYSLTTCKVGSPILLKVNAKSA